MGVCCTKKSSDHQVSKNIETDGMDRKKILKSKPAIQKLSNKRIIGNSKQIIPFNIKNNHLVRDKPI